MLRTALLALTIASAATLSQGAADRPLKIATFRADATPPLGAPLGFSWYGTAKEIVDPLSVRGIVLLSDQQPVVLCAVDWILLGNGGHDAFRDALAKAAGTTRERVCVHCLHQHDAPGIDFSAEELLSQHGMPGKSCDLAHARGVIDRTAKALAESLHKPQPVTHLAIGKAKVEQVASNRRIIGPDGKSKAIRWSATKDAAVRAEPEGLIDPYIQLLGFWNGDKPLASLTYYATHPQSYYGKGAVSCDFPGIARTHRDAELPGVAHLHFNGAGGNITAGKYNDGDPANRPVLAKRLATGMKAAWDTARKVPVSAGDLDYRVAPVTLPHFRGADVASLRAKLADAKTGINTKLAAALHLAFVTRCQQGPKTDLTCLRVGPARVLHMPGELFIEYQLFAQNLRPGEPVLMAAYGDCGAGYIGTAKSYDEGGYEPRASRVSPEVEKVLQEGIRTLLK